MDRGDRVLGGAVRAEPGRARLEPRLENGLQYCLQARLDHAVGNSGEAELPEFPGSALRYPHLPYLDRPELARLQRVPDMAQELLHPDPGLDHSHRGLVDTRCP